MHAYICNSVIKMNNQRFVLYFFLCFWLKSSQILPVQRAQWEPGHQGGHWCVWSRNGAELLCQPGSSPPSHCPSYPDLQEATKQEIKGEKRHKKVGRIEQCNLTEMCSAVHEEELKRQVILVTLHWKIIVLLRAKGLWPLQKLTPTCRS